MAVIRKVLINPHKATKARRKPVSKAPAKRLKKNPGTLTLLGAMNPQRKTMAVTHKKAKPAKKRTAAKKNPFIQFNTKDKKTTKHRRIIRRNPDPTRGLVSNTIDTMKDGLLALAGLVATRQLPQLALGAKNTGIYGYGANLIVILAGSYLASKALGKVAGKVVGIGGALYLADRVMSENFSPIGNALSLSGVGDHEAIVRGLGGPVPAYFASPVGRDPSGNLLLPAALTDEMDRRIRSAAPAAAPAPAKLAGYGRR